jgi:hypothetical protein
MAQRTVVSRLSDYGFEPKLKIEDSIGDVLDHYLRLGIPCASS